MREGQGRNLQMNDPGKSDRPVVPTKQPNKAPDRAKSLLNSDAPLLCYLGWDAETLLKIPTRLTSITIACSAAGRRAPRVGAGLPSGTISVRAVGGEAMSSSVSSTTDLTSTRVPEHDDPLYVTRRCFGMGTCRNIAPQLFGEVPTESDTAPGGASVLPGSFETGSHTGVLSQPQDDDDFAAARDAAKLCPP